jgi:hypothetical protein
MNPLLGQGQRGSSLIIIVLMIVIVGMIGAVFVSLISTEGFTAMNQSAGLLAFGIADGGLEFEQYNLAQNVDWYKNTSDPMLVFNRTLGAAPNSGSFAVQTNLPATTLKSRVASSGVTTINVYTTDRFPSAGYLQIDDDITDGQTEYVQYTTTTATSFGGTITRNKTIGTQFGSTVAHDRGSRVYPVTTLVDTLAALAGPSPCAPTAGTSFRIFAHTKFLTAGIVDIEGEEINYSSSATSGGFMTLNGVTRCANSTSGATSHTGNATLGLGAPVTPLLVGGSADFLAEVISVGTVPVSITGNTVRTIRKIVQR